jgi:hypothetical protein
VGEKARGSAKNKEGGSFENCTFDVHVSTSGSSFEVDTPGKGDWEILQKTAKIDAVARQAIWES